MFYKKIDFERFPRVFNFLKNKIPPLKNVTQIIGTNGKGSTGRFLAQMLMQKGANVGHYTSPHIFSFNERFWLNGEDVSDEKLQQSHEILQEILGEEISNSLSYFEYATLLMWILFLKCDYCVIEAGMGGEFDATSKFHKKLNLFTPVGLDHMAILGDSIEKISHTKFIKMAQNAILNDEMNEISVKIAKEIAENKNAKLKFPAEILTGNEKAEISEYIKKQNLAKFQISNLSLAFAGAKFWGVEPNLKTIGSLKIHGRMEQIAPNIFIDVGHNELAAKQIAGHFAGQKITLIYNAFLDKDAASIFKILKPIIKKVEIFEYKSENRELIGKKIEDILHAQNINFNKFKKLENNEIYLVFGSFMLVENFLKFYGFKDEFSS